MNTLPERLQLAMNKKGLTQTELATMSGTSQVTISNILKGVTDSPRRGLEIARALDVSPSWLLTGDDSDPLSEIESRRSNSVKISLLDNRVLAGDVIVHIDCPDTLRSVEFSPESFVDIFRRKDATNISLIIIDGDSMYNHQDADMSLKDRDIAIIDTSVSGFESDGIYAFEFEGRVRIKRLQYMSGYRLKMISDNPKYDHEILERDQVEKINFIGKLIEKLRLDVIKL